MEADWKPFFGGVVGESKARGEQLGYNWELGDQWKTTKKKWNLGGNWETTSRKPHLGDGQLGVVETTPSSKACRNPAHTWKEEERDTPCL